MAGGLFSLISPPVAKWIYTVLLKPKPLRMLAQAMIKKLIPPTLKVQGVELVLNQQDAIVSGSLALGLYETHELKLFQEMLQPGMTVLDIGANIGLYSAVAARTIGPSGRVIAIEPGPHNCAFIRQTIELNQLNNIDVVQKAVSNVSKTGELFLCADNLADHRIYGKATVRKTVPVDLVRVDDLLSDLKVARVDVIKMDVQGAEFLAWEGMQGCLQANPQARVLMEFWPWGILQAGTSPLKMLEAIRAAGYEIDEIDQGQGAVMSVAQDAELAARDLERDHANLLVYRKANSSALPAAA